MDLIILRGAASSLIVRVLAALLILAGNVLLARGMTVSEFGLYNYLIVTVGLIALVLQWGTDKSAIKFVPAFMASGDATSPLKFTRWGLRRILRFGPLAFVATIVACLAAGMSFSHAPVIGLAGLAAVAIAMLQFIQQIQRSYRAIVLSQLFEQVVTPAGVAAIVCVFLVTGRGVSLGVAFGGYFLLLVLSVWWLTDDASRKLGAMSGSQLFASPNVASTAVRGWLDVSTPLAIGGVMSYVLIRGEVLVVGWFLGPVEVAGYSIALRVANLMIFGLSAATAIGGPRFSELHSGGDAVSLQKAVSWAAVIATLLGIPVLVVSLLVPDMILGVFGPEYRDNDHLLRILAISNFVKVFVGPVSVLLMVAGEERFYVTALTMIALTKLVLLIPAATLFGIHGVVAVSAGMTVCWTIVLAYGVHSRLRILPLPMLHRNC